MKQLARNNCALCALLAILAAAISGCENEAVPSTGQPSVMKVGVVQPVVKPVTDYVYFTGRTNAPYSQDVRAKVNGYLVRWNFDAHNDKQPVKDFNFVVGQEVKRDQVLFKIDPRPYQALYDQALAQINLAQAQLVLAKADYARALNVAKTPGAISQQDVDKYLAAQGKAEAEVKAQEANAESARLNLEFTDVKTDITGIVGRNLLSVGNLVETNTLLTTVVSEDPMYAYFDVDEATFERFTKLMREGKLKTARQAKSEDYSNYPVDLGFGSGQDYPYTAYIDFVNNQVDPTTGTLEVRGAIKNPKPPQGPRVFVPGMFLRVRLPVGDAHPAMLIPQAVIGSDQAQKYVMIINSESKAEKCPINVGEIQPDTLQVAIPEMIVRDANGFHVAKPGEKGEPSLTPNDRIINGKLQLIRPGMSVEILPTETK